MSKIELPTVTSGYNLSTINTNFQKIEDTLNKEVLYRKGYLGEPNGMQTNLDMNGNQILNVTTGTSDGSLVTKGYVDQGLALKFDKSGGPMSGSVDMSSNEIINVSRLSANTLEIGGVQVVPTDLVVDTYNGTREALRRSYAEAGYNLVDGSFEAGGTLVNSNDVLLQERTGKAFSGPAGAVAAGTDPTTASGFVMRSDAGLRGALASDDGANMVSTSRGDTVEAELDKSGIYLSSMGGDLQSAINQYPRVLIDQDYTLGSTIVLRSNVEIKTVKGAKITVMSGGQLVTPAIFSPQYYRDVPLAPQIALSASAASGDTVIMLESTAGIAVGDKLILKNGHCDMWRILETSLYPREAVDTLTYMSEIVSVVAVTGNALTVSPLVYDYPLVPRTYGYLPDENALPEYAGYTRPSATRMLYKNINLDIDVIIDASVTDDIARIAFVDGVDVSFRSVSMSTSSTSFCISMSDRVNVHDVKGDGYSGVVVQVQETSRGSMSNLQATDWRGGSDTPFLAMLLASVTVNNVNSSSSVERADSSGFYVNTCDGAVITNVTSKNFSNIVDVSFSRHVVASGVVGKNCDHAYGAYCASNCILSDGVVDGYCLQNASTSIYTSTLIYCSFTTNTTYENIKRLNDKGYGRIRINQGYGSVIKNIKAPNTVMHVIILAKGSGPDAEPARGVNNKALDLDGAVLGGFNRYSSYYDEADDAGYTYPHVICKGIKVKNGVDVELGGGFHPNDYFEFEMNGIITLGNAVFGTEITGIAGGITTTSGNRGSCYPNIKRLKLMSTPAAGVFNSVDAIAATPNAWSVNYFNGAVVTDVYSRKSYANGSNRGSFPTWVPA